MRERVDKGAEVEVEEPGGAPAPLASNAYRL
jgi:hypothetical protein